MVTEMQNSNIITKVAIKLYFERFLGFLPGLEVLETAPQENVVFLLVVVELVPLAPVVRHRVREDLPVLVEGALSDGLLARLAGLELGASVLVPEGEPAVAAHGGQGAVHRVEGDVIDGEDILVQ